MGKDKCPDVGGSGTVDFAPVVGSPERSRDIKLLITAVALAVFGVGGTALVAKRVPPQGRGIQESVVVPDPEVGGDGDVIDEFRGDGISDRPVKEGMDYEDIRGAQ